MSLLEGHLSIIDITLQSLSGESQSSQIPVLTQGVFRSSLLQSIGAATFLARCIPAFRSLVILFTPTTKTT